MAPQLNTITQGHGPLLVLSHALGLDLSMWDAVAALLQDRFTVLRYDHRGHGGSAAVPGPWSVDDLADDAAALITARAGGEPVCFVGLSMGGMTAQALAARHPGLLGRIVIANSAAFYPDRTPWTTRVAAVRAQGIAPIAAGAVERWLTPGFRATPEGAEAAAALQATLLSNSPAAYADACEAVGRIDYRESNRRITQPVLVVAGSADLATPPALSREIAEAVPGARYAELEAAHISAVEKPAELAALIAGFLYA